MKNNLLRILIISTLIFVPFQKDLCAQNGVTEEKPLTLKVMAYNIHHANPPESPDLIDLEAIVEVIRNEAPDIVALQEVDVNTERSGPINQAEEIARRLNMNYFFAKAIDYDGGEYGVAILSKFPISGTEIFRLPTKWETNGEPRVVASADIELGNGRVIKFGSTHLDAQGKHTNRLLQVKEIAKISQEVNLPFIIAGDFNAVAGSEVIEILDNHFTRTCDECPFTISAKNPTKAIDFIAFRDSEDSFKVSDHRVIDEPYASDHLPLVAEIEIK